MHVTHAARRSMWYAGRCWFQGVQTFTHLQVDPLKLTEVNVREVLRCDVRKVPDRQEEGVNVVIEDEEPPPSSSSGPQRPPRRERWEGGASSATHRQQNTNFLNKFRFLLIWDLFRVCQGFMEVKQF